MGVGVGIGVEVDVVEGTDDVDEMMEAEDEVSGESDVLVAEDAVDELRGVADVSLREDTSVFTEEMNEARLKVVVAGDETSELAVEDAESIVENETIDAVVDGEDIARVSTATARECQLIRTTIVSGRTHRRRCC